MAKFLNVNRKFPRIPCRVNRADPCKKPTFRYEKIKRPFCNFNFKIIIICCFCLNALHQIERCAEKYFSENKLTQSLRYKTTAARMQYAVKPFY